jgi:hypothetical protein
MMGGDSNNDDMVSNDDHIYWPTNAGKSAGYEMFDHNLDGQIDNKDKNDTWFENLGSDVQIPN